MRMSCRRSSCPSLQHDGRLQHRISYTDGEVQWTSLAEEAWRRLSGDEALAARLQLGALDSGEQGRAVQQGSSPGSSKEQQELQLEVQGGGLAAGGERQQQGQGSPARSLPAQRARGSPAIRAGEQQPPSSVAGAAASSDTTKSRPDSAGRAAFGAHGPGRAGLCKPASTRQAAGDAPMPAEQPQASASPVQHPQAEPAAAEAAGRGDPYLFVPNTEVAPDTAPAARLPPAAAHRKAQQEQQMQQHARGPLQVRAPAARRTVAAPPRFHQTSQQHPEHLREAAKQVQDPAWLQQRPASAAGKAARHAPSGGVQQQQEQQHFSRKRKGPEDGGSEQAAAVGGTALVRAAPAASAAAGNATGHCSEQLLLHAEMGPAGEEPPLDTQDAAGALFTMLQARQPAGNAAVPRPLRPTSRHNAAQAAGAARAAGAAAAVAASGTPVDFVAASQLFDGLPPMQAACTAQHSRQPTLQDPGLFDSSRGGSPGDVAAAPDAAARAGVGSEDPGQLRLPDLFKGATPSQPCWLPDNEAAEEGAELAAAVGAAVAADPEGRTAVSPVRVCIVISNTTAEIQQKVLRLQQLLPGVELQEHVTE